MPLQLNCVNCDQLFYCHPSEAEKGRKYCSVACRSAHLHKKNLSADSRTPVEFDCQNCGNKFTMMKAYLTAYRKKYGRNPKYCSLQCSNEGRRKTADERNKFTCAHCGKVEIRNRYTTAFRIYRDQKYCSQECKSAAQEIKARDRFNSGDIGRHVKRHGYVFLSLPALVSPTGKKTEMSEHRYVMAKHLERDLFPEETVHHINGIRSDNRIENLELFSSRHGPGQRVIDKLRFAVEMIQLYPELTAAEFGYGLCAIHPITDAPVALEARQALPPPSS